MHLHGSQNWLVTLFFPPLFENKWHYSCYIALNRSKMYLLPDHEEDLEVRDILFLAWCKRVRKHRRTSKVCGHWDSRCHWHTFAGRFAFGRWFHPAPYPFDEVGIHQVWQSSLELTSDFEWNPHHLQDNIKNVYSHPPLRVMTRYGISWASGGQRSGVLLDEVILSNSDLARKRPVKKNF